MKKRFYLQGLLIGCLLCLSPFAKAVSVPIITFNLVSDTVCSGTPAYYIVNAVDTALVPGTLHYAWQYSPTVTGPWSALTTGGPFTVTGDSLLVATTVSLTGYKFRVIISDSAGSVTSDSALLKVDTAYTGTITGPSAVCVGSTIHLTGTVPGGTWYLANDSASITPSGFLTGVHANGALAGHDTVYLYFSNSCGSARDTAYVDINPTPETGTISGPSIVCQGSTIALTESITGGVWSISHPTIDTVASTGVVTGLSQGFDTVKFTTTLGACSASAVHPVRVDTVVTAQPVTGPSVTCIGNTIVLMNANVLGTWVWSATNTRATVYADGHVHGNAYGLDTFTYVFTNACNSVTSSTTVLVDSLLNPGVISGPSVVCAGSLIHLTESVSGGIWLSSNSSQAIVDGSGFVTGVAAGAPTISYIRTNGCGLVAATHTVIVDRAAGVITGLDSVGIGASITLADSATSGTWSVSDTTRATVSAGGVVTGLSTGTVIVSYTVTNACGTTYATKLVHVGPAPYVPAIDGVDSLCLGTTITLSDTVTGGTWSSSADSIATVSSTGVVTGVGFGLANISYVVHNGFGTTIIVKPVFVNRPPVIAVSGPSVISLGGDYFLFGAPWGGTWTATNAILGSFVSTDNLLDTLIGTTRYPIVTFGSFVVIHSGTDTLIYTATNSCGTRRDSVILTLAPPPNNVNTVAALKGTFSVFPNPNNGEFTLNLASPADETADVTITNVVGVKVRELSIVTNSRFQVKLEQPAGIYIISAVTASGEHYTSRITLIN